MDSLHLFGGHSSPSLRQRAVQEYEATGAAGDAEKILVAMVEAEHRGSRTDHERRFRKPVVQSRTPGSSSSGVVKYCLIVRTAAVGPETRGPLLESPPAERPASSRPRNRIRFVRFAKVGTPKGGFRRWFG